MSDEVALVIKLPKRLYDEARIYAEAMGLSIDSLITNAVHLYLQMELARDVLFGNLLDDVNKRIKRMVRQIAWLKRELKIVRRELRDCKRREDTC